MGILSANVSELKNPSLYRAVFGELLGVLFLVFVGCNSPYGTSELDHTRVALSFGLSVATLVWILAKVSGGHINPAVSVAMLVTRKITLVRCLFYVIAQCCGAILGSLIQCGLTCNWQVQNAADANHQCELGLNTLGAGVSPAQGVFIEFLVTFVLVMTVFATVDSSRGDMSGSGPLAIGLSVAMCHLGFIHLTGSSMNSARSFGPAVVLGNFRDHWVYWVGPIPGGVAAAIIYEFLFAGNAGVTKFKSYLCTSDYDSDAKEESFTKSTNKISSDVVVEIK